MKKSLNDSIRNEGEKYNDLPYESFPFAVAHPSHMQTLGTLFGLKPVDINKAKILELGCAAGNNIIPIAANYPESTVVGVDISKTQILEGQKQVKELKLKNIELKVASITDIDSSWGKFDYIICQGVYSWVPPDVQAKILEICKNNLTTNGIVLISYNTLPGWNMVSTTRELMRYHARYFESLDEQIEQAKSILAFTKEAAEVNAGFYYKMVEQEISIINSLGDTYMRHEYLTDYNSAFYFYEFMKDADNHELQYLADAYLQTMYLGNYPQIVQDKLSVIQEIVQAEQYMDFISNRRFRCSLLTHKSQKITRGVDHNILKKLYISMQLQGNDTLDSDIDNDKNITFFVNDNSIATHSKVIKALLIIMYNNKGKEYKIEQLIEIIAKRLNIKDTKTIEEELLSNLLHLTLRGYASVHITPPQYINEISQKPKIMDFARYLVKQLDKSWTTNQRHCKVELNIFNKLIMQCLDGCHDKQAIEDYLVKQHKKKAFDINIDNNLIQNEAQIKQVIKYQVEASLKNFATLGILVG